MSPIETRIATSASGMMPTTTGHAAKPRTPEEAARQFEEVLVRQFVKSMTDGLFKHNLAGEGAPSWVDSNHDTQRDMLTDVLTRHLTESGSFNVSEMLLKKWGAHAPKDAAPDHAAPSAQPAPAQATPLTEE